MSRKDEPPPHLAISHLEALAQKYKKRRKRAKKRVAAPEVAIGCAGCGKDLGLAIVSSAGVPSPKRPGANRQPRAVRLKLHENAKVVAFTCIGRSRYSSYSGCDYSPKVPCERKARERLGVCPGCGRGPHADEDGIWRGFGRYAPGTICRTCKRQIELGAEVEAGREEPRTWHVLDSRELFGYLSGYHGTDPTRALTSLLAGACAAPGQRVVTAARDASTMDGPWSTSKLPVIPVSKNPHRNGRLNYDPAVELSSTQAEALQRFAELLQEVFDETKAQSRQEGQSLILGLANGEYTAKEFNERAVQQLQKPERS